MKKYIILLVLALAGALFASPVPIPEPQTVPVVHPLPVPTVTGGTGETKKDTAVADLTKERDQLKADLANLQKQFVQAQATANARLTALEAQRNSALNEAAIAKADLSIAQQQLAEVKKP